MTGRGSSPGGYNSLGGAGAWEGTARQGSARGMIMAGRVSGRLQEPRRVQETGMGQESGSVKGHLY